MRIGFSTKNLPKIFKNYRNLRKTTLSSQLNKKEVKAIYSLRFKIKIDPQSSTKCMKKIEKKICTQTGQRTELRIMSFTNNLTKSLRSQIRTKRAKVQNSTKRLAANSSSRIIKKKSQSQ